jgi:hypothetical protein
MLYLSKCAEQYYKIIKNYRNYWLSDARSSTDELMLSRKLEKCEQEQMKEKSQLLACRSQLLKLISDLHPNWPESYPSIYLFLADLETSPSVTQAATTLYGNFYLTSKQEIKEGIVEYGDFDEIEKEMIRKVKNVTVVPYKDSRKCVYFTDKIVISRKKKSFAGNETAHVKRASSRIDEQRTLAVIQENRETRETRKISENVEGSDYFTKDAKSDDVRISEKVTKEETESYTKPQIIHESEESSGYTSDSYYETDEDEEYLARLSVSQK